MDLRMDEVYLESLDFTALNQLVAASLRIAPEGTAELSELIQLKTDGNPFFVISLLEKLQREDLLCFDREQRRWTWDATRIRTHKVSGNVVDFLTERLAALPEATIRLIRLAAFLGSEIDLDSLALIAEQDPADCAPELWPAIREGVLIPLDDFQALSVELRGERVGGASRGCFRFPHDQY